MINDNRHYKRIDDSLKIKFNKHENKVRGIDVDTIYTKNISAGGFLFYSKKPITIDEIVDVKFFIADRDELVQCVARVVRVDSIKSGLLYEIGIQILDMKEDDLALLDKYVNEKFK